MSSTKVKKRDVVSPMDMSTMTWPSWRWLDEMFHDFEGHHMIKVEQFDEGGTFVVRAELPGLDPDKDIQLEIVDGELVLHVEKSAVSNELHHHVQRSEFHYGSMTRTIPLPRGADEASMRATYSDGILEIRTNHPAEIKFQATRPILIDHN